MIRNLTEGSVFKQLIIFSSPFVLSNILQTVYNLVDMIIVGQYVGSAGITAVGLGGSFLWMLTSWGMGFANGGQVLIAQLVGANDREGVSKTIGTMFSTIILMSIFMGGLGVLVHKLFLNLVNTPAEAMAQSVDFLVISSLGMVFIYGYNMVSAMLRGMGDSKRPLIFIAIASAVNLILNLVFVAGLKMEAAGSALATVLGQGVSFILSLIYLYLKRESFGFDFKPESFKIRMKYLKPLVRIGLPMGLQYSAINFSMLVLNAYINVYGISAAAVASLTSRLNSIMQIVTATMTSAGAAMIGQNFGAGKTARVKRIFNIILLLCTAFFVAVAVPALIFPEQIFSIFDKDPAVLAMAPKFMVITVVTWLSFATMTPSIALLNGIGFASLGFVIGMLDGVVARISLGLLLGGIFGLEGFFWGSAFAGFVTTIIGAAYYYSGMWKKRKLLMGDRLPDE
jgi:putative MATE family efflux protein